MDSFAKSPIERRRQYFEQASMQLGISPAIIEKDFWVCWVLKSIFSNEDLNRIVAYLNFRSELVNQISSHAIPMILALLVSDKRLQILMRTSSSSGKSLSAPDFAPPIVSESS